METNIQTIGTCPVCHQPTISSYHFCPNCGTKLDGVVAKLSTTVLSQIWIYALSVVLPPIGFIFIKKWPGMKYFRSTDSKTQQIGQIALALILLSTVVTIWLTVVWTKNYIQSSVDSINTDFGSL